MLGFSPLASAPLGDDGVVVVLAQQGNASLVSSSSLSAQGGVKVFALASLSSVGSTLLVGERILFGATQLSSSYALSFLGELKYGGRFKPIVGEPPRWTEGGDTRVTEDGEPRVADNVSQNIGESNILIDSNVTLFTSEVYAKYLDVWNVAETYVKNNGEWVEPVSAYQNINGNWKRIA